MSAEGVHNFLFGDKLSDLDLKPKWDRYRGYFFIETVVLALAMVYILQVGITIDCLPITNDTQILENFSDATESFVESFCVSEAYNNIVIFAILALYCCGIILLYNKSIYNEHMYQSVLVYAGIRMSIEKLDMSTEQIKILSISPCREDSSDKEEIEKVREACDVLWNLDVDITDSLTRWIYCVKNFWLLVILFLNAYTALSVTIPSYQEREILCTVTSDAVPTITYEDYNCVWKVPKLMFILGLGFTVGIVGQICCVIYAINKSWGNKYMSLDGYLTYDHFTDDTKEYLRFGNIFWENSDWCNLKTFQKFLEFMGNDAALLIKKQFDKNCESIDVYVIGIYSRVSKDYETIAKMIYHNITKSEFKCESNEYKTLIEIVKKTRVHNLSEEVWTLLDYVYAKKYFEIFVALLEIVSPKEQCIEYLSILRPNLDAIGQPYVKGNSLLYYSTDELRETILRGCGTFQQTFFHHNGISITKKEGSRRCSTVSLDQISRIRSNLDRRSCRDIAEEISHYKFTPWTDEVNEFAKNLCQRKLWEVLVALMNAFIIDEQDDKVGRAIPNCYLDLFSAVNTDEKVESADNSYSLLYFAFTKRDYAPFSLTAAATILYLTRGEKKKVCGDAEGVYEEPMDFVMGRSDLSLSQHIALKSLIRNLAPR